MLRTRPLFVLIFLAAFLGMQQAHADKIILKSGEVVEGKVIFEDDTYVRVSVAFSPTIREEQVIPKARIRSIDRQAQDEVAFETLRNLQPPSTALSHDALSQILDQKIIPFLTNYSTSKYAEEVRQLKEWFESEKSRLEAGEIKIEGIWLKPDEASAEKYQTEAVQLFHQMELDLAAGDLRGALNLFNKIESTYPHSAVFPQAARLASLTVTRLDGFLSHQLRVLEVREREREEQIVLSSIEDQRSIREARERELTRIKERFENALKSGVKFPPYEPISAESMQGLQNILRAETARISSLDLSSMEQGVEKARQSARLLAEGEYQTALNFLEQSRTHWAENELLARMEARIRKAIDDQKASSAAQAASVDEALQLQGLEEPAPETLKEEDAADPSTSKPAQ